jgi:cytoskeleton protein RodZ
VREIPVARPAPQPQVVTPTPEPVTLTPDAKAIEVSENSAAPSEAASDFKVLLDLMAREETWLSVSSDGKPVFSGTLFPNQTKTVEGKQFAQMRVGNAAGLEIRLNGKLLGPLGARGQVLTLLFTPDNVQIVAVQKESD